MSEELLERRRFRIVGRVQGVFFRAWTRDIAEELGLRGAVQNRLDGSVEAEVEGTPDAVSVFRTRLWEGPAASLVEGVEELPSDGAFPDGSFLILPTT